MTPLSYKRRLFSLIGLGLVFIIGVPLLWAYSTGYRFDAEQFRFVETGGVFIHSNLSGSRIFIDEEYVESNGFILRNFFIQKLKSERVYSIRVEKDNYLPWYKDLYVYPNLVTEGRIMMLPIEIPFELIEQVIEVAATATRTGTSTVLVDNPEYVAAAELFATTTVATEPVRQSGQTLIETVRPTSTKPVVLLPDYITALGVEGIAEKEQLQEDGRMVAWLESGNVHVMWAGTRDSTPFFFCDIRGCRDKILVSLDTDINEFTFFPGRSDVLVVQTGSHIFAVEIDDRSRQNLQIIYEGGDPSFVLIGNTIYVKDGEAISHANL